MERYRTILEQKPLHSEALCIKHERFWVTRYFHPLIWGPKTENIQNLITEKAFTVFHPISVLDFHVVADEEVIEDAIFPLKFKSLSPNLTLPLSEILSQTSPVSSQNDGTGDIREVSTMRRKSTRANMTIDEELECINEVVRRQVTFLKKNSFF